MFTSGCFFGTGTNSQLSGHWREVVWGRMTQLEDQKSVFPVKDLQTYPVVAGFAD